MIGQNIRALRQAHQLTQPDFARMLGISRNTLSRYENGTNAVSTEILDLICQKLNVSYVELIGEERLLTPLEDYDLTLKIEIVKERGANLLARLYRCQEKMGIEYDDESNAWVLVGDDLAELVHTNLYFVTTFEEIERYTGYLDGIERMINTIEKRKVA